MPIAYYRVGIIERHRRRCHSFFWHSRARGSSPLADGAKAG